MDITVIMYNLAHYIDESRFVWLGIRADGVSVHGSLLGLCASEGISKWSAYKYFSRNRLDGKQDSEYIPRGKGIKIIKKEIKP